MHLLILGGSIFLGRHIVSAALQRGHTVTTFNRGTQKDIAEHEGAEKLIGDRNLDMTNKLAGRTWDAVIDTSCYTQDQAAAAAKALKGKTDLYCFISSVSVYDGTAKLRIKEDHPILYSETLKDPNGNTYGAQKGDCERLLQEEFPEQALIIRPGLIAGPYDPTDRFTYWPSRVAVGGVVLAPGRRQRQVQFIDVRDLAQWTVAMCEGKQGGVFNATGPDYDLTMEIFLGECKRATASNAVFRWLPDEELLKKNITPWVELPLWIPENNEASIGFMSIDSTKAHKAGLLHRPIDDTIRATQLWDKARSPVARRAGIAREKELQLLGDPNAATLKAIASQLESLKEEAEMLKRVSVQLETLAASVAQSEHTPDELTAIIAKLNDVEKSLFPEEKEQDGNPASE